MKLALGLPLAFCVIALTQMVTASPQVVKDSDIQRRSPEEKAAPTNTKTKIDWKSFSAPTKDGQGKTVGLNAHGALLPLGSYGGDCTLNWVNGQAIGGGFNNGLSDKDQKPIMGLGGGFNYNDTMIDVGAGISAFDHQANYHLSITNEGKVVITFDSTKPLKCTPSNDQKAFTCTT